jgi:SAM-dependent methyltransferase
VSSSLEDQPVADDWIDMNRANWDERVGVHMGPRGYNLADIRAGLPRLDPIAARELPMVAGKRVLHLQCHFGADTLRLAQLGAEVVGLDFSPVAIDAARALAEELGLATRARFVLGEVSKAASVLKDQGKFDLVYSTWGTITWLSDIKEWARLVSHFLEPAGTLYLAEQHPLVQALNNRIVQAGNKPTYDLPYFLHGPIVEDDERDYSDNTVILKNSKQYSFIHSIADVVTAIQGSFLQIDWMHEHDAIGWAPFEGLIRDPAGLYRWPDKSWLPLAFSLQATRLSGDHSPQAN